MTIQNHKHMHQLKHFLGSCLGLFCCFALSGQPLAEAEALAADGDLLAAAELCQTTAQEETEALSEALLWDAAGDYFRHGEAEAAALTAFSQNFARAGSRALDSLKARALHLSGVIHMNGEEPNTGYRLFHQAVALRRQLHPAGNEDLLRSIRNLAVYHLEYAPTVDSAQIYIEQAMTMAERVPDIDPNLLLYTATMRAKIYARLQDRQSTRDATKLAEYILKSRSDYDSVDIAFTYYDLGLYSQEVDDLPQVYHYSELADAAFSAQAIDDWAANAREMTAAALQQEGKLDEALVIYLEDRSVFEAYEDIYSLPYNHYNVSLIARDKQEYERAATEVRQAIEYVAMLEDTATLSLFIHGLGTIELEAGQLEACADHYAEALSLLLGKQSLQSKADLATVPREYLAPVADLLEDRSKWQLAKGQLDQALADLELVFALQDRIRTELPSAESQQYISENIRPFFQRAIHLRYLLFQETEEEEHLWEALRLSERAKAFSLLQARQNAQRERPARERELARRIVELERLQLNDESYEPLLASARLELQRIQRLEQTQLSEPESLEIASLLDFLARQESSLLEYALGEEHSYWLYVSSAGAIQMQPIPKSLARIAQGVEEMRHALRQSAFAGADLRQDAQKAYDAVYLEVATELGQQLLPALQKTERLIIVADGVLGYLPFAALLADQQTSTSEVGSSQESGNSAEGSPPAEVQIDYSKLPYLARGRELCFSYSMAYLLDLEEDNRTPASKGILALAPTFNGQLASGQIASSQRSADTRGDRALPGLLPLLHNEAEVDAIAELFPGQVTRLKKEAASRDAFMEAVTDYQIIHLSSHALVNPLEPDLSFVAFSQLTDSLEDEEILYLLDLSGLQLRAELAVLSACETGLGQISEGEGVLSLARAFSMSGAASTLTTLWKVDDQATKEIMVQFYDALASGAGRRTALTQAQQMALEGQYAHPYYWSALTLYGASGPLEIPASSNSLWLLGLAGLGIGLSAILLWRRRNGKVDTT